MWSRIIPKIIGAVVGVVVVELGELAVNRTGLSGRDKDVALTAIRTMTAAGVQMVLVALRDESFEPDSASRILAASEGNPSAE